MKKMLFLGFSSLLLTSSLFADNSAPVVPVAPVAPVVKTITDTDMKVCTSCHGISFEKEALGKSKIVKNMSDDEVKNALLGYKNGTYGGVMKSMMKSQVNKYSETDLEQFSVLVNEAKKK